MKAKYLYLFAAFLAFGSAGAVTNDDVRTYYEGKENGDFKLYLFGSHRALVCEEKDIQIIDQGDAIHPVILECKHQ
jgi:hypothetical protein